MRTVRIDRAPPKRLLATLRWRSFKVGPDQQIWDRCLEPVVALLDQGMRITRVQIEWGPRRPWNVDKQVRALTLCDPELCELSETQGQPGRGYTEVTLTND